jgi:hypothetical protein
MASLHFCGSKGDRLEARAAVAIDLGGRNTLVEVSVKYSHAGNIAALLTHGDHAAHHDLTQLR